MIPLRDNIPTDRFPIVTLVLIAINVAVFIGFQNPTFTLSEEAGVNTTKVVEYGLIPYRVSHPDRKCQIANPDSPVDQRVICQGTRQYAEAKRTGAPTEDIAQPSVWLTLFTSMFMHAGWLHIGINMLFLWIFGNNVEDSMGRHRYVAFYLLGGLAAAGGQVAVDVGGTAPMIGASGAVAAVLGGYALLYPRARVLTIVFMLLIFLVEIPALILLGLWFILQFLPAVGQFALGDEGTGGGVAYFAHIGGFLFGLALIKLFAQRRSRVYDEPPYPVY